ncbi:von Willebrand factor type A [Natronorubrum bangense JCM 10635]|uniref:von Willebrand factor type A n=2 Tax=Natronorubrum bangense TaxID=61858 RepID=L9WAF9_9EURY|nr:von Willebrand factor type A [Natronorubrum bangense JCM 10635]
MPRAAGRYSDTDPLGVRRFDSAGGIPHKGHIMTNDTTEIGFSRRRVLAGLGAVGIASAGAGLGTTAYFSDQESFAGNTLTAGQLDLSVTWQQLYYGADQSVRPGDYGSVGRPFVNAYPDHDGNGLQSFERNDGVDEYVDLAAYSDPVEAAKEGTNLEFSCAEIATFDDPSFAPNQESLIELEDVKPGDAGEVTFGIKLCDNPGYIWLHGDLVAEGDGGHPDSSGPELADMMTARAWYDLNGNNVFDEGEPAIVSGTLREVLEALNEGVMLAYDPDPDLGVPNGETGGSGDGETLGDGDDEVIQGNPTCEDLGLFRAIKIESEELPETVGDSETYATPVGDVTITVTAVSGDDIREFDFELEGFEVSAVIVKGGAGANVYSKSDGTGSLTAGSGEGLGAPFRTAEQRYGVSHVSFCYEVVPPEEPPADDVPCFQPSNTRFIAFEWHLPTTVGNEVQGDSIVFDLSFYTEQCRHNPDPANPFGA